MCPGEGNLQNGGADVSAKVDVKPQFLPYFHLVNKPKLGAEIVCGGRSILLRGSTGERGPMGPFPFITLTERKEEGDFMEGYCVHSEAVFDEVWDKLKELVPSRE